VFDRHRPSRRAPADLEDFVVDQAPEQVIDSELANLAAAREHLGTAGRA
jgi:hypothetical protein